MDKQKHKKIAVDIDCVIAATDRKLELLGFRRKEKDGYEFVGADEDFFRHNPEFYQDLEVVPGSVEAVSELALKHDILYITSRDDNAYEITRNWIISHGFPESPIYFTKDKGRLGEKLGIDLALDDSPVCARSYIENGIEVRLMPKAYNSFVQNCLRFDWSTLAV